MTYLCLPERITLTFSLLFLETGSWMATVFVLMLDFYPIRLTLQVASIRRTRWWLQLLFWRNLAHLSPVPFKQHTDNPIFSEHSRRQETVSMLTVSGPQQTSFTHMHRYTHSPLWLLWRGGPVVIYSPCCHKPNVSCNNFHELSPSLLLFVDFSAAQSYPPAKSWLQTRLFNFHSSPVILLGDLSNDFYCFGWKKKSTVPGMEVVYHSY